MRQLGVLLVFVASAVFAQEETHWSLKPIRQPAPPKVLGDGWVRSDVDRFLLAKMEQAGVTPNVDADRATLVRRISFDLVGLPPEEADLAKFLNDSASDDAVIAKIVDHYLQSPRFGERWARHWLDVVRYADSVGRSWNAPFTYAWRYRDYVIDAYNADLPYDRFMREQIAGDLLPSASTTEARRQRLGTGLLALGSVPIQEGRAEAFRLDQVDDQIDVTTRAFLGVTLACARCHDHKTDAFTMHDYYALAGIFYSCNTLTGQGARAVTTLEYVDGNLLQRLPGGKASASVPDPVRTMSEYHAVLSRDRKKTVRYTYDADRAMGMEDAKPRDCAIRIKGDPYDTGKTPARGDLQIEGLPKLAKIPADASGRLQLANWLALPENPLPARVYVNRVWLHLFGRGLVPTPDDFGVSGLEPTHPELLDHLASRFVRDGWSTKTLIRGLMLSRVYRQSSAVNQAKAKDASNEYYSRASLRRLEWEAIRDALWAVSGKLRLDRPEGIPVSGTGGKGRGAMTFSLVTLDDPYRTIYVPVLRSLVPESASTFDLPDPCQIQGKREITTSPPQALYFLNNSSVADCARRAAEASGAEPNAEKRVHRLYRLLLGREASVEEVRLARAYAESASWADLAHGLIASAEFRYLR